MRRSQANLKPGSRAHWRHVEEGMGALWAAVIRQARCDACNRAVHGAYVSPSDREQAQAWLRVARIPERIEYREDMAS